MSGVAPIVTDPNGQPLQDWELNLDGAQLDLINSYAEQYMPLVGWDHSVDKNALMKALSKNLDVLSQGFDKVAQFFYSQMGGTQQSKYQWANYGMAEDKYHQAVQSLSGQWMDLAGFDIPHDVMDRAIRGQWSAAEMMDYAQKTYAGGDMATSVAPWLAIGATYQSVQGQFQSAYGASPADTKTLASWFRFQQGAKQVGGGAEAAMAPAQTSKTGLAEVR